MIHKTYLKRKFTTNKILCYNTFVTSNKNQGEHHYVN